MKKLRVSNKRVDDDLLMKKRRAELDRWPTGKEVDFEEAVAYQNDGHSNHGNQGEFDVEGEHHGDDEDEDEQVADDGH